MRTIFGAVCAMLVCLAAGGIAKADAIAHSFIINNESCAGSVCGGGFNGSDNGSLSGNIFSTQTLAAPETASAYVNLTNGDMGTFIFASGTSGQAGTTAEHDDTWFCATTAQCNTLETPGSSIPIDLTFHIAASGSLLPEGGYMDLKYTFELFGDLDDSSASGGFFQFEFGQDPGIGPDAAIFNSGQFWDFTTNQQTDYQAIFSPEVFDSDQFAFTLDVTVHTSIAGCPVANCDLTQGVFGTTQKLNGELDRDIDFMSGELDSSHTFGAALGSDIPFTSQDGQTSSLPVLTPEPATAGILSLAAVLFFRRGRAR